MKKLGTLGRRWVLTFHVLFASIWIGTALSINLILLLKGVPPTEKELYAIAMSVKVLDDFLIIPSAMGIMVTGLLISMMTKWGFFKFYWVTVKWVITLALLISGTFWLFPWLNNIIDLSNKQTPLVLQGSAYMYYRTMLLVVGNAQALVLLLLVLISVFKPWGESRKVR